MNVTLLPGKLRGEITVPPSKSHVQRLLLGATLSDSPCEILCAQESRDIQAMVRCLQTLGAGIRKMEQGYTVTKSISSIGPEAFLDCGESGAVLRFMMPLCCCLKRETTLAGHGRLKERPMGALVAQLRKNGAVIRGDTIPFQSTGGLKNGTFLLPGTVSSQYFSGLLLTLPLLPGESILRFTSRPESFSYIEMTLKALRQFGIRIDDLPDGWRIPGNQCFHAPACVTAEGDWSAAAYWIGAAFLDSKVQLKGLQEESVQGDRVIRERLEQLGGEISLRDCPDLGPILAVCAMTHLRATVFTHTERLRFKETDRVKSIVDLVRSLGGRAEAREDSLTVFGGKIAGGTVNGQGDHRIVMGAAIASLAAAEPVHILDAEAVEKSYPSFFQDFERLGGKILYE